VQPSQTATLVPLSKRANGQRRFWSLVGLLRYYSVTTLINSLVVRIASQFSVRQRFKIPSQTLPDLRVLLPRSLILQRLGLSLRRIAARFLARV